MSMALLAECSPYLRQLMERELEFAARIASEPPDQLFGELLRDVAHAAALTAEADFKRALRQAKAKAALLIAAADVHGTWQLEQVTLALTRLADACLQAGLDWLLAEAVRNGQFRAVDSAKPSEGCGYTILAMGKHGAFELNYSSDIDIIVLFDGQQNGLMPGIEPSIFFVRLTRKLVGLLQDVTEDGYVFRVDLRLRPDPRATQVAMSMEAAAIYYESMGQNWERAAMIKARAAAGDLALGAEFLDRLKPYVWRKYLDFAAIADIQSLKRQIHAVKGHGAIAVHGHDIKLGRGGIREIEFFVQTQQLIAGGRNEKLRGRSTMEMLDALAAAQWISPRAAIELQRAYRFLRLVEHRIQMVNDEQSHVLPADTEAFRNIARFSGFADPAVFEAELRRTFELVQGHYAALFENAPALGGEGGSLVFTGGEDDPETIQTLSRMGFKSPSEVSATIRGWHFGRYAATRSARARERLTELMPALLTALAATGDADAAFLAFDKFLSGLPTGVQLFSLLRANPRLLDLLASILGTAPRLSEELSRRPKVLDAVLDPGFFGPLQPETELRALVASVMPPETPLEETVDRARILGKELAFRVGVRVISDTVGPSEAGQAYSDLASALLSRLHGAVTEDMAARHGRLPGGASAVIALGKLGGFEMTAGSDLDLIVVYTADTNAESSDGAKSVSLNQYYAKLTQRLVSSLTAPTAEGVLYDVDLRLRPSGNKGPVATSFASFASYQVSEAWTWEKLALTRARPICGDPALQDHLRQTIRQALCAPRDSGKTVADVLAMRSLMLREQGSTGLWDIKRARGGLVEVEFIAQTLQLIHAPHNPGILDTNTLQALRKITGEGLLSPADGETLTAACLLYHRLTQVLRLCVTGAYDPASAPAGLNRLVASAAQVPDITRAEALLMENEERVAGIFDRLIGRPDRLRDGKQGASPS